MNDTMNCTSFERRLESYLDDGLDGGLDSGLGAAERAACDAHLGRCAECRELVEAAGGAAAATESGLPPATDLLAAVIERTSGAACPRARDLLAGVADGPPPAAARGSTELLAAHLERCDGCRATAAALAALARELPRLAEVRPDPGFVDQVLAATLPAAVRLRRWWARSWPRWVHRPRFAAEAAFAGLLVLVAVSSAAGAPLWAAPRQAVEEAEEVQQEVGRALGAVERKVESRVATLRGSQTVEALAGTPELAAGAVERLRDAAATASATARTWWRRAASLFAAEDGPPATQPTDAIDEIEETP
jgi:predicted anti-sigma-YlaC factor YlaD